MTYYYMVEMDGAPYGEREFQKPMKVGDRFTLKVNPTCATSKSYQVEVVSTRGGSVAIPSSLVVKKV